MTHVQFAFFAVRATDSCVPYAFCVAVLAGTCSGALFCRFLLSAATAIIPASTASRAVSRRVRRHVSPTASPSLLSPSLSQRTAPSSVSADGKK